MKTLTIKDLARTEQLDSAAMAGVRGGWSMAAPSWKLGDLTYAPKVDSSITAAQNLFQQQDVSTLTANGSAFVHGVHVNSDVHQDGENKIIA
jgi:hypothetical protein